MFTKSNHLLSENSSVSAHCRLNNHFSKRITYFIVFLITIQKFTSLVHLAMVHHKKQVCNINTHLTLCLLLLWLQSQRLQLDKVKTDFQECVQRFQTLQKVNQGKTSDCPNCTGPCFTPKKSIILIPISKAPLILEPHLNRKFCLVLSSGLEGLHFTTHWPLVPCYTILKSCATTIYSSNLYLNIQIWETETILCSFSESC